MTAAIYLMFKIDGKDIKAACAFCPKQTKKNKKKKSETSAATVNGVGIFILNFQSVYVCAGW